METKIFMLPEDYKLMVATENIDLHGYRRAAFAKEGCFCWGGDNADIRFNGIDEDGEVLGMYIESKENFNNLDDLSNVISEILYGHGIENQICKECINDDYDYTY